MRYSAGVKVYGVVLDVIDTPSVSQVKTETVRYTFSGSEIEEVNRGKVSLLLLS